MKKMTKRNEYIFLILIFTISLVFAYLLVDLTVNGTMHVKSSSFDVHFENIQVEEGSVTPITPATITGDTEISLEASLNIRDYYNFSVDVVNDGTLDAMIGEIDIPELTSEEENYLEIKVKYDSNSELNEYDLLKAGESRTIDFKIKFKNVDIDLLPEVIPSKELSFAINYKQADENAQEIDEEFKYIYSFNYEDDMFKVGKSPIYEDSYESFEDYGDKTYRPMLIRQKIVNDIVVRADIGFILSDVEYYLIGRDESSYEQNKSTLTSIYGASNCEETNNSGTMKYTCMNNSLIFSEVYCDSDGEIFIQIKYDHGNCTVLNNGYFYCDPGSPD